MRCYLCASMGSSQQRKTTKYSMRSFTKFEPGMSRRAVIMGCSALGAATGLAGCAGRSAYIDPMYLRQSVQYDTRQAPGTIVVDPSNHFLYHVQEGARAVRYGVGVGGEGFGWSGIATVHD